MEEEGRPKSKRRRMQPLHQGKGTNKGRRRRTFPRSDALTVLILVISLAIVLRRTKDLLIPRLQQQRMMDLMMMQP